MIKICTQKGNIYELKSKCYSISEDNKNEEEEEEEAYGDGEKLDTNRGGKEWRRGLPRDRDNRINHSANYVKKDNQSNIVRMKELKLIPTHIFWLQLIALVPLLPILPVIFYPLYEYIHQFQMIWAASLLSFKCGARWTSLTLQPKYYKEQTINKRKNSWSWAHSWESLASAVTPACLAAFALFLSFPSCDIILTYAFIRILTEDLSKSNQMPSGYLELEIITCLIAVLALLSVFFINIMYLTFQ